MMKKLFNSERGFTLIELMIVIAIIAIITVALLPTIRGSQAGARDAGKKALMNSIVVAIENSINNGGSAPTTDGCLDGSSGSSTAIRDLLGRPFDTFVDPKMPLLCLGNQVQYTHEVDNKYFLAVQVEEKKNANVNNAVTAARLTSAVGDATDIDTVAQALAVTGGAAPSNACDVAPGCFYLTSKQ